MNTHRPYCVLAKLDSDRQARFWIRQSDGRYEEWTPMSSSLPKRRVKAERLTPVRADFAVFVGDPQAVAEIHHARDQVLKGADHV